MRPEDLLARLKAGYEYDPMYGQLCNERDQLKAENAKLRELAENLIMAFMVLETPEEQRECIDRAIELRHELNVLPMEIESDE